MKIETKVEMTELEERALKAIDAVHATMLECNAAGEGEYKEWAYQNDEQPYGILNNLWRRMLLEFFLNEEVANAVATMVLDCGESATWLIYNRTDMIFQKGN